MDELLAVLAIVIAGVAALYFLRVPVKEPPKSADVQCPTCLIVVSLSAVRCQNCKNTTLKIETPAGSSKYARCMSCECKPSVMACPKCGTNLFWLFLK